MNDESTPEVAAVWDAGELGCGELIIELRRRVASLEPGQTLDLIATDPAAPIDIAAWCRITGHRLCLSRPPHFFITRKET
jgi:tRNA 2-thiouridine synthesizing protein A